MIVWLVFLPYLLILLLLFAYGLNFYFLSLTAHRRRDPETPPPPRELPAVTVQLPLYNERYVAARLLDAACGLDWPRDRLEIQVLDDSTDDTRQLVRARARRWRGRGVNVRVIGRPGREGYKAGALAFGLEQARGELVAVFDADFLPPPDFLRRTVPHLQDPGVGFVQVRWGHLNADYSLFTRLQALAIDGHFMVEQFARERGGFFMNFNGTAGIWRRSCIRDAGGWQADTLTEDLDLSYRAQLRGWRPVYLRQVVAPAELPVTCAAYRRQQHRWARGSIECARKLLPRLWRAPLPLGLKLQASLHLTGYAIHLLMLGLALLYPLVLGVSIGRPHLLHLYGLGALLALGGLAPTVYFALAQRSLDQPVLRRLPLLAMISVLGSGMMLNSTRAIGLALAGGRGPFERTPKFGISARGHGWTDKLYQVMAGGLVKWELGLALYCLLTCLLALRMGNWAIGLYSGLFAAGNLYVAGLTLAQALQLRRVPWRPAGTGSA